MENKSPLLDIKESISNGLKRKDDNADDDESKTGSKSLARIKLAYDGLKNVEVIPENPQDRYLMKVWT